MSARAAFSGFGMKPPGAAWTRNIRFNNVVHVAADKIGAETATYVRNIYKYYIAYRLALEASAALKQAREEMKD